MTYNSRYILQSLQSPPDGPSNSPVHSHDRLPRTPTLPHQLPSINELNQEATKEMALELTRQSLQLQRERELAEAMAEEKRVEERKEVKESQGTWAKLILGRGIKGGDKGSIPKEGQTRPFERPPNAYELYAAIDKKDIMFIARVRDHSFPLLLQKNAGEFPIIYASRIGDSHKDIVILLCGTLSRYVNNLDEEEFENKSIISTLRLIRLNLKLAIDNSLLPAFDSSLLSSYLQVLIMSEGDVWIHKAVHEVGLYLRTWEVQPAAVQQGSPQDGTNPLKRARSRSTSTIENETVHRAGPVSKAETLVKAFCTKELKNTPPAQRPGGLGLQEYIANSTMDLVLLAAWGLLAEGLGLEGLPTYTFSRDLRTYSLFVDKLEEHERAVTSRLHHNHRLASQIEVLKNVCGDTRMTIKGRVEVLKDRLDGRR